MECKVLVDLGEHLVKGRKKEHTGLKLMTLMYLSKLHNGIHFI